MPRNERQTCTYLIEPALAQAGWTWQAQLRIGRGRVNLSGANMYDETQEIVADYVLRYRDIPLVVLEAKAETESAADGMQQASRYARRLSMRVSLASTDPQVQAAAGADRGQGLRHAVDSGAAQHGSFDRQGVQASGRQDHAGEGGDGRLRGWVRQAVEAGELA